MNHAQNVEDRIMKKRLEHRLKGCYMPEYLIDILTVGYSDTFLPMSIFKEGDAYTFSYDEGALRRIDYRKMNGIQKLKLVKSLIEIADKNNDFLIPDGGYAINTNTIYGFEDSAEYGRIKLMYYPDIKCVPFWSKLSLLINDIFRNGDSSETEIASGLINAVETQDINRVNRFIEKRMLQS